MAEADDAFSTIWLSEALDLAHEALGSREGAKRLLTKGLANKAVPWSCQSWEGPDEAKEDRWFWSIGLINWEDNSARDRTVRGAAAWGIRVSNAHVIAMLPGKPRERERLGPKEWLGWALKEYPPERNERPTDYIKRLHGYMQNADNVTEVWEFGSFRIRYYEALKADQ
jgi:hypothetical protein